MDISEQWLLYATAALSIVAIVTTLIMSIVVLVAMKKGISKVYELFSFLHKESEQRIGKANLMVSQCTTAIEKAAVASEHCASSAESSVRLAEKLENDCLKEITDLKAERNRLIAEKSKGIEFKTYNMPPQHAI